MRPIIIVSLLLAACATAPVVSTNNTPYLCKYALNPAHLGNAKLRLAPGSAQFASITAYSDTAGVEYRLPFGPPSQGARLTFTSRWVTMNVLYEQQVPFFLSTLSPHAISPVLTAPRGAIAIWSGSSGKQILVSVPRPGELENHEPVSLALPCNQTTIALIGPEGSADEPDAGVHRVVTFDEGTRVPVSATPGGETVEVMNRPLSLTVIEENPTALHVHQSLGNMTLDGWVSRALVKDEAPEEQSGTSNVYGDIGIGALVVNKAKGAARCAAEVPLMLRFEGALHPLGTLRKNAAWKELKRTGDEVEITLPELDWFQLEPGAAFVITASSAAACVAKPLSASVGAWPRTRKTSAPSKSRSRAIASGTR